MGKEPEVPGDLTKGSGHLGLTWLTFPSERARAAGGQLPGVGALGSGWRGALTAPLLQWPGLCAGVSCEGADWELALGPAGESSSCFFPQLSPWVEGTFQPPVAFATWHSTWRHGG